MPTEKINVLVTGVGGGGVGEGIVKSLKINSEEHKIVATDMCPLSAALFRVDMGYVVPQASDSRYSDSLISICKSERIVAIVPGSVPELKKISDNREKLEQENITLIMGSKNLIDLGNDKWRSYEFLSQNMFTSPKTYLMEDSQSAPRELNFPMYIKPREGYGSRCNYTVHDREELELVTRYLKK